MEDVETDGTPVDVYVRVVAWCVKFYGWRHIRIVRRKRDGDFKAKSGVNLDRLGEHDDLKTRKQNRPSRQALQSFRSIRIGSHRVWGRRTAKVVSECA